MFSEVFSSWPGAMRHGFSKEDQKFQRFVHLIHRRPHLTRVGMKLFFASTLKKNRESNDESEVNLRPTDRAAWSENVACMAITQNARIDRSSANLIPFWYLKLEHPRKACDDF